MILNRRAVTDLLLQHHCCASRVSISVVWGRQDGEAAPAGCGVAVVDDTTTAYLDLRGVLDAGKEVQKLQKKRTEVCARDPAQDPALTTLMRTLGLQADQPFKTCVGLY